MSGRKYCRGRTREEGDYIGPYLQLECGIKIMRKKKHLTVVKAIIMLHRSTKMPQTYRRLDFTVGVAASETLQDHQRPLEDGARQQKL